MNSESEMEITLADWEDLVRCLSDKASELKEAPKKIKRKAEFPSRRPSKFTKLHNKRSMMRLIKKVRFKHEGVADVVAKTKDFCSARTLRRYVELSKNPYSEFYLKPAQGENIITRKKIKKINT